MPPTDHIAVYRKRLITEGIIARGAILSPFGGGADNRLFTVEGAGGHQLVVKIRRGDRRSRFAIAAWAAGQMTALHLPTPEIIWQDQDICVETRCVGRPLADGGARRVPSPHDLVVAIEAGTLLRRLHTIPVRNFGRLDMSGTGCHPSLHDWLTDVPPRPVLPAEHNDLSDLLQRARQALGVGARLIPSGPPRMLHGDWTARHVIADAGRVSGLVDLESVRGGDPLADVAGWSLQEAPSLTGALLAGYFTVPPERSVVTALALYRLRIAGSLLRYHAARGDSAGALLCARQIEADLADLAADDAQPIPRITPSTNPSSGRTP